MIIFLDWEQLELHRIASPYFKRKKSHSKDSRYFFLFSWVHQHFSNWRCCTVQRSCVVISGQTCSNICKATWVTRFPPALSPNICTLRLSTPSCSLWSMMYLTMATQSSTAVGNRCSGARLYRIKNIWPPVSFCILSTEPAASSGTNCSRFIIQMSYYSTCASKKRCYCSTASEGNAGLFELVTFAGESCIIGYSTLFESKQCYIFHRLFFLLSFVDSKWISSLALKMLLDCPAPSFCLVGL